MNILTYRGLSAAITFDAVDAVLTGRISGINDVVGFHAESPKEIFAAFKEAVDDYFDTCARIGKKPEKPYSGKLMLRVDPRIHARAALAAELSGKSLNQWSEEALSRCAAEAVHEQAD